MTYKAGFIIANRQNYHLALAAIGAKCHPISEKKFFKDRLINKVLYFFVLNNLSLSMSFFCKCPPPPFSSSPYVSRTHMAWELCVYLAKSAQSQRHWLINFIDTEAKWRHLKKIDLSRAFAAGMVIRVYRLETPQSVMLVFSIQPCELLPI